MAESVPQTQAPAPRRHTGSAILGALLLCVIVPCFLIWWRNRGSLPLFSEREWSPSNLGFLLTTAVILLSPGTAILAVIALSLARKLVKRDEDGRHTAILATGTLGSVLSFFNFPGYLGVVHLDDGDLPLLRILILYGVTGFICGAWIGWQAYREAHPKCPFFPRYSLGTLVLLALAVGVLIGVFLPR
jgi:hypothetical protein